MTKGKTIEKIELVLSIGSSIAVLVAVCWEFYQYRAQKTLEASVDAMKNNQNQV